MRSPTTHSPPPSVEQVDTRQLEKLAGYNVRRASLAVMDRFATHMQQHDLKVASYSVLSLIAHNPGITSRQLCATLAIQPPNLVGIINELDARGLLQRLPHPTDGRAVGLHLTKDGAALQARAEATVDAMEDEATQHLSAAERKTLIRLLQKIYR
ncbi:MarR family winged helix-turn-helix transcriptional regulator [Xylophilus sp. ASV27]|uniref:MarR family winged helix-turn-helix transcriptional regulator n=1 Tax=Xylophilus sp. ASV27 TaxID=2795129 RepID=UPI0018ED1625|nr:MarR family winged helix-turn-helix transcriptional regulator [Xylophilus sp. ASV27]